ncbi:MAG: hypothetical protein LCH99_24455 [Proteobacteria bacterium]|nr:hypothetical protein [Pseudomonadota bacterium]
MQKLHSAEHLEALGWAFTHAPTHEAYRRSTREDIGPVLARYRQWLEENIIGRATEILDHDREEAA